MKQIKQERRVELAMGEGHRYWDLRRWRDAAKSPAEGVALMVYALPKLNHTMTIAIQNFILMWEMLKLIPEFLRKLTTICP